MKMTGLARHMNDLAKPAVDPQKRSAQVLVTGHTGRLGSALFTHLRQSGKKVDGGAVQDCVACIENVKNSPSQRLDVGSKEKVSHRIGEHSIDTIYHLAALSPFRSDLGEDYYKANVKGTEHILNAVLSRKTQGKAVPKVFVASSALVFEPLHNRLKAKFPSGKTPISEDRFSSKFDRIYQSLLKQVSRPEELRGEVSKRLLKRLKISKDQIYYNDSKLLAEIVSFVYAKLGVPVTVARLVNCYGKNSTNRMNDVFLTKESMHNPYVQSEAISQFSDILGRAPVPRDYLYYSAGTTQGKQSAHDDVCRLIHAIAEKGTAGETYHISSNGQFVRTPQSALRDAGLISKTLYTALRHATLDEKRPVVLENSKLKTLNVPLPQTSPKQGLTLLGSSTEI